MSKRGRPKGKVNCQVRDPQDQNEANSPVKEINVKRTRLRSRSGSSRETAEGQLPSCEAEMDKQIPKGTPRSKVKRKLMQSPKGDTRNIVMQQMMHNQAAPTSNDTEALNWSVMENQTNLDNDIEVNTDDNVDPDYVQVRVDVNMDEFMDEDQNWGGLRLDGQK